MGNPLGSVGPSDMIDIALDPSGITVNCKMQTDQRKKYDEENQTSDFINPLFVLLPTHDTHLHVDVDL